MGPEKLYENKIKNYIKMKGGWEIKYWSGGAMNGKKFTKDGVPDILACIKGRFVAIETKAPNGKPTALQIDTIEEIRDAGGIAVVAYPSGWNTIKEIIDDPLGNWSRLPIEIK